MFVASAIGQRDYQQAIDSGYYYYKKGDYKTAINKYFAAEAFDPSMKNAVKDSVNKAFYAITSLKNEALKNLNAARIAEKKARANSLSFEALIAEETDPNLALRLAEQAMMISDDYKIRRSALQIYLRNNFYKTISDSIWDAHDYIGFSKYGDSIIFNEPDDDERTISPNGKFILTYPSESKTNLCDINGNIIQTFNNDGGKFYFLPNNELVNIAIDDDRPVPPDIYSLDYMSLSPSQFITTIQILYPKKKLEIDFTGHFGWDPEIIFLPDGEKILTCSKRDSSMYILNLPDGSIKEIKDPEDPISSLALSPGGITILTGGHIAKLWDLNGKIISRFNYLNSKYINYGKRNYPGWITDLTFSPNGRKVLTYYSYYHIREEEIPYRIWDLKGNLIQQIDADPGEEIKFWDFRKSITALTFSHDGNTIVAGSMDGSIRLWNLANKDIQALKGHTERITALGISQNDKTFFSSSTDGTSHLWNAKGEIINDFIVKGDTVTAVAFSNTGDTLLTGSMDGTVCFRNMKGEMIKKFIDGIEAQATYVGFSSSTKTIFAFSNTSMRIWDLSGKSLNTNFGDDFLPSYYSPDSKKAIFGQWTQRLNRKRYIVNDTSQVEVRDSINQKSSQQNEFLNKSYNFPAKPPSIYIIYGNLDEIRPFEMEMVAGVVSDLSNYDTVPLADLKKANKYLKNGSISLISYPPFTPFTFEEYIDQIEKHPDSETELPDISGVTSATVSPDFKTIILEFYGEHTSRLFDMRGNLLAEFDYPGSITATSHAFSSDGKIIIGYSDGSLRLYNSVMPLEDFLKSDKIEPLTAEQKKQYGIK